jgi:hypothetical protein
MTVRAHNASDLPVFDVSLRVEAGVRGTYVRQGGIRAPGETREWEILFAGPPSRETYPPDLLFTDVAGQRWLREGSNGRLSQASRRARFEPDPAMYDSVEDHPHLLATNPDDERGRTV